MGKKIFATLTLLLFAGSNLSFANEDTRVLVKLPQKIENHMMSNMRDHLMALNEIIEAMAEDKMDKAAKIAESRLGMSSMSLHGASKAAPYMPKGMRQAGFNLHKAATRFALKAEEEDQKGAMKAFSKVVASCVACHAGYRVR